MEQGFSSAVIPDSRYHETFFFDPLTYRRILNADANFWSLHLTHWLTLRNRLIFTLWRTYYYVHLPLDKRSNNRYSNHGC